MLSLSVLKMLSGGRPVRCSDRKEPVALMCFKSLTLGKVYKLEGSTLTREETSAVMQARDKQSSTFLAGPRRRGAAGFLPKCPGVLHVF